MASVKQLTPTIKTPPGDPRHVDELLDEAIDETFPASDPIAVHIDKPARNQSVDESPEAEKTPRR